MMNNSGNAYIEYLVLATIVLLATVAFYDGGNFQGTRGQAEQAFDHLVTEMTGVAP